MRYSAFGFLLCLAPLLFSPTNAFAKTCLEKKISAGAQIFDVKVFVDRSSQNPAGYCGAGEEITLKIYTPELKQPIFSKLIASCLHNIELKDADDQNEPSHSLEQSIHFTTDSMDIALVTMTGDVASHFDFSSGKLIYSEKTSP